MIRAASHRLFSFVAAPAGAAGTFPEATPASPGEFATSVRPGEYYSHRPGNGVAAGETAQLDSTGAAAWRYDTLIGRLGSARLERQARDPFDSDTPEGAQAGAGPASALQPNNDARRSGDPVGLITPAEGGSTPPRATTSVAPAHPGLQATRARDGAGGEHHTLDLPPCQPHAPGGAPGSAARPVKGRE